MKKGKRLVALFSVLVMMVSIMAIPASADVAQERLKARIYGGAVVSSKSAKKVASGNFTYMAAPYGSDGWSPNSDEWVYVRGRTLSSAQATTLDRISYNGISTKSRSLSYLSGSGIQGNSYRIAIEYDNNNPYEWVNLTMTWTP